MALFDDDQSKAWKGKESLLMTLGKRERFRGSGQSVPPQLVSYGTESSYDQELLEIATWGHDKDGMKSNLIGEDPQWLSGAGQRRWLPAVQQKREELALIIPSIAKEIDEERANGGRDSRLMDTSVMQAEIIDHLHSFIETTALPAMEERGKLSEVFDLEMRRSQQKLDCSHRLINSLQTRIDELIEENTEAKETIEALTLTKTCFDLKRNKWSNTDENIIDSLENTLTITLSRLASCQREMKAQKVVQNKLEKQLRNYYQKVHELTYEKDYAISQKRTFEKKYLEIQHQLFANESAGSVPNPGVGSVNEISDYFAMQDQETPFDGINTVELPYSPEFDDDELPEGLFNRTTEGDVNVYNLNEEIEVDDYENADDLWPDESDSSDDLAGSSPTVLVMEQETEGEPEFVDQHCKEENSWPVKDGMTLADDVLGEECPIDNSTTPLSMSKSYNINILEGRGKNSAWLHDSLDVVVLSKGTRQKEIKYETSSQPYIPGMKKTKKRKKKVGDLYLQRIGPEKEQVQAKGAVGFKAALSLFKKLEELNPGRPQQEFVKLGHTTSVMKRKSFDNDERLSHPRLSEKHKSKIVAKVRVKKQKQRSLNPILKDYIMITKSCENPRQWAYRYGHKFFACLDALPATINTNANEPGWAKAKKNGELRPCLFWFENEQQYKTLEAKVAKMNVRSIEFQESFAELALGIIVLAQETAVGINERRALHQLHHITERDIKLAPDAIELKDANLDIKKQFAIVTKCQDDEKFESHNFRAGSEEKRDWWMSCIRSMLRKRLLSIGGENLGRTIARLRKRSSHSYTGQKFEQLLNTSSGYSLMRTTFSKPNLSSRWSNNSLTSGLRQDENLKSGRHRKFNTGLGKEVSAWMTNQREDSKIARKRVI